MESLRHRRVTILGLGHFGGGIATARWLCEQGAHVTVSDREPPEKLADSLRQLEGLPITFHLGQQQSDDFAKTDLLVTSPAVMPTSEPLTIARDAGVPITTEICLFVERCPARCIGITGTKGKSTTTAMIGAILQTAAKSPRAGKCFIGGNIGRSLLAELPNMNDKSTVVLELSSYMLHWLNERQWSPHTAVVTMLGRDHLEWHGSEDAYIAAKRAICAHQPPTGRLVRRDDALSRTFVAQPGVEVRTYPTLDIPHFDLAIPGSHNQANAQAAFLATQSRTITHALAQRALRTFTGLPHRLQLVHEHEGVRFFNDSIATIPEAAIIACDAFDRGTVVQIVGGSKKDGLDYRAMSRHLSDRCKIVLTIGEIGLSLYEQCEHSEYSETLDAAVERAKKVASPGDVILLSPGTASYDQFTNFEQRGQKFAELARAAG